MSNQPYQPYDPFARQPYDPPSGTPHGTHRGTHRGPYDGPGADRPQPAGQEPGGGHPAPRQEWPGSEDPQYTQQWQGQTWETQAQPPVTAPSTTETAYLPPQQDPHPGAAHPGAAHPGATAPGRPGHAARPAHAQAAYGGSAAYGASASYGGGDARGRHGAPDGLGAPRAPDGLGAPRAHDAPQAGPAAHGGPAPAPAPAPSGTAGTAGHPQGGHPQGGQAAGSAGAAAGNAADGPSYGPATLAGNSRVTDAQRARLEGRSPVIEPGMQPAALTALLALLLSGAAAVGSYALLVPLVVLQALTAAGWFRLNGMWPARQGIALAFAGAVTADAALVAAGRGNAPAALLGTLGVWVLLVLVLQLRSHADPDERMYGLMATVVSAALAILAAGFLAAEPDAAVIGAAAVAVALPARVLPLPTPASAVVSLLAAAGAGIAAGGMTGVGARGALIGAVAAACALIGHRVASYDYPSRFVHFTAGVALPLAAAAPVLWVLGRGL